MFFRQYYLGCLSHASYLIGDTSSGRAIVVDPQRDIDGYLTDAAAAGLTIERVLETHFHADFLSGHLELAEATGAVISFGEQATGRTEFAMEPVAHGQRISLGEVELEILATPGHTPESISIVVRETPEAAPYGVLTGDTLFIGDVGRPDLLSSVGVSADGLARQLYHSLHEQLMTLPDDTKLYPAHGAGSACGKNLSTETVSTIGEQRRTNYALAPMTEDQFAAAVTQGQAAAPLYFLFAANKNREARDLLHEHEQVNALSLDAVLNAQRAGAAVVDTRDAADFAAGHLRGSINIGLGGRFAEYTGEVVRPGTPIVLIGDDDHDIEARVRLSRIGFDTVLGALDKPMQAFVERPDVVDVASRLTAEQLRQRRHTLESVQVVDVRGPGEIEAGMIDGATHIQLPSLLERMGDLDPNVPTVVYCAGGYRSSIAASTLRSHGFADVSDVLGGFGAWEAMIASGPADGERTQQ